MGNTRTYQREASKKRRIEEGEARNAYWRSLSRDEQLADLDKRLGKGVGAKRQRERLGTLTESRILPGS